MKAKSVDQNFYSEKKQKRPGLEKLTRSLVLTQKVKKLSDGDPSGGEADAPALKSKKM